MVSRGLVMPLETPQGKVVLPLLGKAHVQQRVVSTSKFLAHKKINI